MTESIFSEVYDDRRAQIPTGLPLVVTLQGFSDAGNTVAQLEEVLWESYEPEVVFRFNNDVLLDYRARRPVITFDEDHLTNYVPEELVLSLARDERGDQFLLLSGYEPDFRWDAFIDTILLLVDELGVSTTVWIHAIPMPVPHTRPIGATVSGSREDLIADRSVWKPTTKLAATVGHVLEHRLHALGEDVVGFVLLVPHYLANTEYPQALLSAIESLMSSTGLHFAVSEIMKQASDFNARVDEQVAENEESRQMLTNLESRYDEYMREHLAGQAPLLASDEDLPTADQLASELERFLAEQRGTNGMDGDGDSPL